MAIINYLRFFFQASTKYQVHSPFVFEFIENVLEDNRQYYFFNTIEKYRRLLYADNQKIDSKESFSTLARNKGIDKKSGQLLFRIINHYKPPSALLLGVFPGIAALYQSTPSYKMAVNGLESNIPVADKLTHYFGEIGVPNIHMRYGALDLQIDSFLEQHSTLPYIYLKDLPSRYALDKILKNCTPTSILVVEKPYASTYSLNTWKWLKDHAQTALTIDVFSLGLVFFREEQKEKADHKLIRSIYKPWSVF